jgi:uncharacterized protein (TIGR03067 family)
MYDLPRSFARTTELAPVLVWVTLLLQIAAGNLAVGQDIPQSLPERMLRDFQGTWDVLTVDHLGKASIELSPQTWTIDKDVLRIDYANDERDEEYRIKLLPLGTPPWMELTGTKGLHAGATAPGVFDVKQDSFRIRVDWDFGDWQPGRPWAGNSNADSRGMREYGLARRGARSLSNGETTLYVGFPPDNWSWTSGDLPIVQYQWLSLPILRRDGDRLVSIAREAAFGLSPLRFALEREFDATRQAKDSNPQSKITFTLAAELPNDAVADLFLMAREAGFKTVSLESRISNRGDFKLPPAAIEDAKRQAARELAGRDGLKHRRPKGLEDLESPDAIRRAVIIAMRDLENLGETANSKVIADPRQRLEYLGDAAFDALVAGSRIDSNVGVQCCHLLSRHGERAVPILIERLTSSRNNSVRSEAVRALGQTYHPDALQPLIAALADKDGGVRVGAMYGLQALRDPRSRSALVKAASDSNGHVARDAVATIDGPFFQGMALWPPELLALRQLTIDARTLKGESFGEREKQTLIDNLDSGFWGVRSACLHALTELQAAEVVPIVRGRRNRINSSADALAKIGTPDAIDSLIADLHSPMEHIRIEAMGALASSGGRWPAPLLVALLDDPSLHRPARREPETKQNYSDFAFGPPVGGMSWPESHAAHGALALFLWNHGIEGKSVNLARGPAADFALPAEMERARIWWRDHGDDFLNGKDVPNPQLTQVSWFWAS